MHILSKVNYKLGEKIIQMDTCKISRKNRSRRAVSPVIATVILVAIAITVAVSIAFWMGGIAGAYTRFEQIEIQNVHCTAHGTPSDWNIIMTLKNTGTIDVTLISLFINEEEIDNYGVTIPYSFNDDWTTNLTNTQVIQSGETLVIHVFIDHDRSTLSSGTMVNLKIHSAGGMDFPKVVKLT
jgi:flagellin-like protein